MYEMHRNPRQNPARYRRGQRTEYAERQNYADFTNRPRNRIDNRLRVVGDVLDLSRHASTPLCLFASTARDANSNPFNSDWARMVMCSRISSDCSVKWAYT